MAERDEGYGAGIAELMNPEVARNPQPIFSMLQMATPVFRLDGVGIIVSSRAAVEEVLRQPDLFSSSTNAHDMKTKRPLIPLQIDPPDHKKYRKILDPVFAPQRMKLLEDSTVALANELIDGFGDANEIEKEFQNFAQTNRSLRPIGERAIPSEDELLFRLVEDLVGDLPAFMELGIERLVERHLEHVEDDDPRPALGGEPRGRNQRLLRFGRAQHGNEDRAVLDL